MSKVIDKNPSLILWYKNDREVYQFDDLHIHFIIQNPKVFGLTLEEIEAVYKRHGENIGTEGAAREEILNRVFKEGWVRLRYSTDGVWFIEVDEYTRRKEKIKNCLHFLLRVKQKMGFDNEVRIMDKGKVYPEKSLRELYRRLIA